MKSFLHIAFLLMTITLSSQSTTINRKNDEREQPSKHRIMVVPMLPRMYMSDLDMQFNRETKLSAREIRNTFRDGLDEQLYLAAKAGKYGVIDLLDDTVKYKKDLEDIYRTLTFLYMKVPDQEHYSPPVPEKEEKKINKGQLTVETRDDRRFMNAKFTSPKTVPSLHSKYGTDIFIFINQIDLKNGNPEESTLLSTAKRKISIHYTVYSYDGKEINSGLAEEYFDDELNDPRKIVSKHFSKIALLILKRIDKGLGVVR